MNQKLIAASLLLSGCLMSGVVLADAIHTMDLSGVYGHFNCTVKAPDKNEVIIDTSGVKVKGPNCVGHALHTTVAELNTHSYYWKRDSLKPKVTITVRGDAKDLVCVNKKDGKPEAEGGEC